MQFLTLKVRAKDLVNHSMLLDLTLIGESPAHHHRLKVASISLYGNMTARQSGFDCKFDLVRAHH
jgi:hypothetical protein